MKTTTKTVREIIVSDLDEEITKFLKSQDINTGKYGYESIAENEWCNYQYHTFTVDGKVSEYDSDMIKNKELKELSTDTILQWMCMEGKIEAGEYLVSVNW